jgi:hypothetical protein
MHTMITNFGKSVETRDLEIKEFESSIKAFDAETKRISAVQASMSPEQIQDIVMGTLHGMITSGDLVGEMPGRESPQEDMTEMPQQMPDMQQMPQQMPQGAPQ